MRSPDFGRLPIVTFDEGIHVPPLGACLLM